MFQTKSSFFPATLDVGRTGRLRRSYVFGWFVQSSAAQTRGKHAGAGGAGPVVPATATKGDIDITRPGLGTVTPLANIVVRTRRSTASCRKLPLPKGRLCRRVISSPKSIRVPFNCHSNKRAARSSRIRPF